MANLAETSTYDAGVYQIETTDSVVGGATGIANKAAINLANRTNWLKAQVEAKQPLDADLTAIAALTGTTGLLKKTATNTWALDTSAYSTLVLGTAAGSALAATGSAGTATTAAKSDHVHPFPTAANVGAEPAFTTLGVAKGGTGVTSLTGLVKGNGTSTFTAAVAGTDYQVPLVSGTNIKTINGTSLLGSGDIVISVSSLNNAIFTGSVTEQVVTANTGTAYTVDLSLGTVFMLTLNENCVYTFPTPVSGQSFTIIQRRDATNTRTATWPSSVRWPGSTAPSLTASANAADIFSFVAVGTIWYGTSAGTGYAA